MDGNSDIGLFRNFEEGVKIWIVYLYIILM